MKKSGSKQNIEFDEVRFSAQIFVVGAILSATFFLLSIDLFKTYRSDVLILVNAKSEIATKQQEQLIGTIVEFPKTLSFYDRLLKYNPNVRDVTAQLSPNERKEKWNEMVSVARSSENSLVFKISIVARREADANQLASKTARTLFDTVSFYYDIKKDFDLRIIEGPISKPHVLGWYWFLAVSIACGFAVATFLNLMLFRGGNYLRDSGDLIRKKLFLDFKKTSEMPIEDEIESLEKLYQAETSYFPKEKTDEVHGLNSRIQEMKKWTKKLEPGKYPNFPEMPIRQKQEAVVPENLPVAEESFDIENVAPKEELPFSEIKEPTPEELKKRLNELLKGNL